MNEVPSPQLRISDVDRESALRALGEHMSVGRITLDEYGDRSARVTAAKTRGELAEIFADLPQPHPSFDGTVLAPAAESQGTVEPAAEAKPATPAQWADRPLQQRLVAAAVPLAAMVGVVLFFVLGGWWWFLLPAAIGAVGGGLWGEDWQRGRRGRRHEWHREHHEHQRERHREHIERQREWHRERHRDRQEFRRELRDRRRGLEH
ncbi:DUF1707 SHOCT-like domain-containing protein [Amycolatopsis nigrescens]|uniref:DUF1707 SHOCT-like domain-containing protein n=1 Tax=Amycolatopsis nigrescens TaxID=381445 RepID=UPI000373F1E4|nr:DUF1707 domain-containing protein [Amycolatopsis nigrescens]